MVKRRTILSIPEDRKEVKSYGNLQACVNQVRLYGLAAC